MKKILVLLFVLLVIGAGFWLTRSPAVPAEDAHSQAATTTPAFDPLALTQPYQNSVYRFSLMMPADFSANESSDPSGHGTTIVLQDKSGDGIQIIVSPFSDDKGSGYALTADRIHQDIPALQITNEQPVDIGNNYRGLAFISDNPAFDGQSREVWFVFHGNLYQISTYARLDQLLQAIFKTWQFN